MLINENSVSVCFRFKTYNPFESKWYHFLRYIFIKKTHQEIFKISSWVEKGRRKFEEARYWKAFSWEQKQTSQYTEVAGVKMGWGKGKAENLPWWGVTLENKICRRQKEQYLGNYISHSSIINKLEVIVMGGCLFSSLLPRLPK